MLAAKFHYNFFASFAMEDYYHRSAAACPNQMNYWAADSNFPLTWQQQAHVPHVNYSSASTSNSNSSSIHQFHELPSSWSNINQFSQDVAEDRATAVSKSHSQAEKRRRDRINAQLATLRKLVPKSEKMDKAALLESAIEHVKELKVKAMEVSKTLTIPTEVDEVTIECELSPAAAGAGAGAEAEAGSSISKSKRGSIMIKASVSCDDQPELYKEIIRVIKGQGLTMVRADISSVGGRIKSILVLCNNKDACDLQDCVSLSKSMKQALHLALSRMSSSSSMGSSYRIRSKRQRLFLPSHN